MRKKNHLTFRDDLSMFDNFFQSNIGIECVPCGFGWCQIDEKTAKKDDETKFSK